MQWPEDGGEPFVQWVVFLKQNVGQVVKSDAARLVLLGKVVVVIIALEVEGLLEEIHALLELL